MFERILNGLLEIRDVVSIHPVFGVGILLVGSFFLGRLASRAGIPAITGFIVAGMILGPSLTGMVHSDLHDELGAVTEVALAIIALVIGSEFSLVKLRRTGRAVVIITLVQMFLSFGAVTAVLWLTGLMPLAAAALLGAVASATAPAATVAIVRDLKARGPFVDHLYGVVALDDAGSVLLFSIVAAFAGASFGGVETGIMHSVMHAVREIGGSVILGAVTGWLIHVSTSGRGRSNEVYIVSLGLIFLLTAVATTFGLSALLAGMTAGTVLANMGRGAFRVISSLEQLSPPLYATFFAIAGTELSFSIFSTGHVVLMGAMFILARAAGKYYGVWGGARIAGSNPLIRKYLGLAMLPQAGVAIGLALYIQAAPFFAGHEELASTMVSIVLMSVFVNELAGPPISKFAVVRGATL
ncbi:MAG: cation:proton antiporter [Candidatus Sabulitectum sp.]|nr:cation:proton antiporter [Candidatus Sabulitectum sp.]